MEEVRLKAYVDLIEQVLACPKGQEIALLQKHPDLMNRELLTVMGQVAQMLRQKGRDNADWLEQVAQHLNAIIPDPAIAPENPLVFLQQTLQVIISSEGNPQRVYPWLKQHLSWLNPDLLTVLPLLEKQVQESEQRESQRMFALSLGTFANLLLEFPEGDRSWNLRCAQMGYDIAGRIFQALDETFLAAAAQESLEQVNQELAAFN